MKSRLLSLLLGFALLPVAAGAQTNFGGITYNYSFSAVDLDKYVGQDSWYGMTVDLRHAFLSNPNVTFGLSTGWYVFYNNVNQLIQFDNVAISGAQYRNFNIVPILASAHYYLGESGAPRPYFGLNVGGYYARQELDIGLYAITESNWHFGLAPEVGVAFPVQYKANFYCNARYHYLFAAGGYLGDQSLTLPFFTIGAGVAWSY